MFIKRIRFIAFAASLLIASSCSAPASGPAHPITLSGAGSSFDARFFSKAFALYSQTGGVRVVYKSIGSSAGIHDFTNGSVDFGATEIPMTAVELAAYPGGANGVLQLPIALGGVVIAYNVPGLSDAYIPHRVHLRLTPDVLGRLFSGSIKTWDDPDIAALNPGALLPALPIQVIDRAGGIGTASMFNDYLSESSPSWSAYLRKEKAAGVRPASSLRASGEDDVAAQISKSRGSIGFVEMATVIGTKTNYAAIRNRAGYFVLPSMQTVGAAAARQPTISSTEFYIDDLGGADSYPIAGYSWLLIGRNHPEAANSAALCAFARWMLTDGQKVAPSVGSVPLPANLANKALAALGPCTGGP